MIRREIDAELVNRISEDPSVRPFICYHDEPIDWTPVIEDCFILSNGEDACGVFEPTPFGQISKDIFQAHTLFADTCRGARAIETARAMLAWMFEHGGASLVWGATPKKNRAARWFNRQIGMTAVSEDDYEAEGPVEIFQIRRPD